MFRVRIFTSFLTFYRAAVVFLLSLAASDLWSNNILNSVLLKIWCQIAPTRGDRIIMVT